MDCGFRVFSLLDHHLSSGELSLCLPILSLYEVLVTSIVMWFPSPYLIAGFKYFLKLPDTSVFMFGQRPRKGLRCLLCVTCFFAALSHVLTVAWP